MNHKNTEMSPVNKSTFLASRQQFLFIFLVASVKRSVWAEVAYSFPGCPDPK